MSRQATGIRILPATADSVATIVEFNRLLAVESENRELDVDVLARGVERALAQPELCRYFLAEIAGQTVGQTMLTYEWSDWRCGVFWWIQSVYVVPEHRGRGVFRALYQHIKSLAQSDGGVCGLRLYVEQHNRPALATYGRMGMAPTGHLMYEDDWSGAVKKVGE
jgi:GNAT superfamily N-acetyltransferase